MEEFKIPDILIPELKLHAQRIDKACKWVSKNRDKIDKNISFLQAIELYDFGIDVTQLKTEK